MAMVRAISVVGVVRVRLDYGAGDLRRGGCPRSSRSILAQRAQSLLSQITMDRALLAVPEPSSRPVHIFPHTNVPCPLRMALDTQMDGDAGAPSTSSPSKQR